MKVLVTGSSGFCGQYLTRYLTRVGAEVFTLSNKETGSPNHYHVADFTDSGALSGVLSSVRPQHLFHLAGVTQADDPGLFYRVNTQYAVALLDALRSSRIHDCTVLLVGTSAEYGYVSKNQLPITEDVSSCPYSHYGISKLAQTLEGLAAHRMGLPVIIARPFNIIGSGMPEHLVVQSFASQIAQVLKGQKSPVIEVGNLEASRDFIDVEDVVTIFWQLVQRPSAFGKIVNVCSGKGIRIGDVLARLIKLTGRAIEVKPVPSRFKSVDIPEHFGSTERLRSLIGEIHFTDIEATLKKMLEDVVRQS